MTREEFDKAPSICVYQHDPVPHPACYEHGVGPGPALCKRHAQRPTRKGSQWRS